MHYESKHWDTVRFICSLHGPLTSGVKLSTQAACATCVECKHPDLTGVYPTQWSEDSPQKQQMMHESYVHIVQTKLKRKRLWRALTYWSIFDTYVEFQHNGCQTEKQCVKAIRRCLIETDRIIYLLYSEGTIRIDSERLFVLTLNGVLQGHEEAAIMEEVKCSLKSKEL